MKPDAVTSLSARGLEAVPSTKRPTGTEIARVLSEHYPDPETRPKLVGPDTGYYDAQSWLNATLKGLKGSGGGGSPTFSSSALIRPIASTATFWAPFAFAHWGAATVTRRSYSF